jgi:hypothetical protein
MTTYNFTTFDAAIQAKLNTASVNLTAQDYLLLAKAVQTAIDVSEGVTLLSLKGTANGVAGLDSNLQVPSANLLNALPSQVSNSGKLLTTNGSVTSWTNAISVDDATVADQLNVGSQSATLRTTDAYTNPMAVFSTNQPDYAQLVIKNTNAGAAASSDYIAYTDDGDDTSGWIDMGITSSNFSDPAFTITGSHDGYIFMEAPADSSGTGNLVLATGGNGTANKIIFAAGGLQSDNTQMEITPDQNIHIEIPTPSTSATTGALTVVGGVGIQGDMNINGDVSIQGTITFGGGGTTVETSNLAVTDPAVFVGTNNQADIVDLAFIGEYAVSVSTITRSITNKALTDNIATLTTSTDHTYLVGDVVVVSGVDATFNGTYNITAVPTTTTFRYAKTNTNVTSAVATGSAAVSARRKFSGIARDASDGVIKLFKDATTKPTTTINFSEAGLAYSDLRIGGLTASSASIGSVTNTEIGYLSGVSSSIQTQLNLRAPLASPTFTGTVTVPSTITSGSATLTLPSTTGTIVTSADVSTTLGSYLTTSSAASTYTPLLTTTSIPTFSSNNYTLVLGDAHRLLLASNGSTSATLTVPLNSSVAYGTGTVITITQTGSGQITLTPTGGVTINSFQSQLKFSGQYASVQLIKTGTDTWLAVGNLAA